MAKKVHLLVGTKKGAFVFTSDVKRKTWSMRGPLLKGAEVNDLVLDTRAKPTLYGAVTSYWWGSNVHISANLGKTWNQSEGGVKFPESANKKIERVWMVKPGHTSQPNVLYAGVDPGALFKSDDAGKTWRELDALSNHPTRADWNPGAGGLMVHSLAIHPDDPHRLFAGISAAGVFATTDGGLTWEPRNKNVLAEFRPDKYPVAGQCVHHFEMNPAEPETLYQQNHCGVYRSDNGGNDWVDINRGLPSRFGFSIQVHPHDPNTVFVWPEEGAEFRANTGDAFAVYRSSNRGKTWKKFGKGLPSKNAFIHVHRQASAVDHLDKFGLYVGTTSGKIFFSTTNGESWSLLADNLPPVNCLNTGIL